MQKQLTVTIFKTANLVCPLNEMRNNLKCEVESTHIHKTNKQINK